MNIIWFKQKKKIETKSRYNESSCAHQQAFRSDLLYLLYPLACRDVFFFSDLGLLLLWSLK